MNFLKLEFWRKARRFSLRLSVLFVFLAAALKLDSVTQKLVQSRSQHVYETLVGTDLVLPIEKAPLLDNALKTIILKFKLADQRVASSSIEVILIDNPSANAFALPDGRIVMNLGILSKVQSIDHLAGILGHEVTHIVEKHYITHLSVISLLIATVLATYGLFGLPFALFSLPVVYFLELLGRRILEYHADDGAVTLLKVCGYSYQSFGTFLGTKMAGNSYMPPVDDLKEMTSTHPIIYKRALRVLSQ